MLVYFLGVTVFLPVALATVFLFNANSLLHRAAVFFMTAVLPASAVWAAVHGAEVYVLAEGAAKTVGILVMLGNFAVLSVTAWLGWRWRSHLLVGLSVIQAAMLGWIHSLPGSGAGGLFALDHLSILLLFLVNGVGPLTLLVALNRLAIEGRRRFQPRFFASATLLIGAMNGLLLTGNLLWLLFFWQLSMVSAFFLLVHDRSYTIGKTMRNTLIINAWSGIAFMAGILLCLDSVKTLVIRDLLIFRDATVLFLPLAFFVLAGFAGSGQVPFQSSVIRVSAANAYVSVLLQTVAVNAGIYLILRFAPLLMNTWLGKIVAFMGAFSFAAAALLALLQYETKKGLTYSTVSTLGLSITLACLADLQAIYAAVLVLGLHGISKALMFLCTGNRSDHAIPVVLMIIGALSMLMPPFGIPVSLWTAIESSARQPATLTCLVAGSLFYMLFWVRLILVRLSSLPCGRCNWRSGLFTYAAHLFLSVAAVLFSVFLAPLANLFVGPVLKENYSRFGDIAQGEAKVFTISGFSGINPLYLFMVIAVAGFLGWIFCRFVAVSDSVGDSDENPQPEHIETPIVIEPIDFISGFSPGLHGRRRLELYVNLFASALILVMFEVIAR